MALEPHPCTILRLGRRPYEELWTLQKKLQQELLSSTGTETLILCQHDPVITFGKSSRSENLLAAPELLSSKGIKVIEIERGGDVTYHGPGQLVGYPILDLHKHRTDVHWYMRALEEVLLRTLADFGIESLRIQGKTGVWTNNKDNAIQFAHLKLASMGVRISRWVTLHGFALNVTDCSEGFALINPCGFKSQEMTWMERECGTSISMQHLEEKLIDHFREIFYS